MKHLPKIALLFLVFVIVSCSKTGTKALESGDYYTATIQAIEKLTKDRSNDKAADVLPNAYRLASDELLKNIQRSKNANVPFRYENALEDYNKLNKMHDLIGRCMACRKLVSPTAYFKETEETRDLAAEERYAFGLDLMKKNTLQAGRDAFKSFEKLYAFAPNYKDVRTRMDDALFMGSVHVVVEQPKLNSRLFSYSNEYFQGQINDFLRTNRRLNQFIRFYEPSEAEQIRLKPNHVIRLEFLDFVVGETRMNSKETIVTSADSVKTGSAKIDGKTVDVYGKVTAKLIQNTKQVRSRGILLMEIYDFQNKKTLLREEFPGEFNWMNEWASFNGDERALNKEQLLLTRNREQLPPPPQDLFIEFCKPIYNQFTSRVKRFYDKF
jgi:hypothetical protein